MAEDHDILSVPDPKPSFGGDADWGLAPSEMSTGWPQWDGPTTLPTIEITVEPPDGVLIVGGKVKASTEPDGYDTVTEHLSSLLQVHNLIVLIGAGASMHLGSPKIRELGNDAIIGLIEQAGKFVDDEAASLLKLLNPKDSGDLEQLLSKLQIAETYAEKLGGGSADIQGSSVSTTSIQSLRMSLNAALACACDLPSANADIVDPLLAHRTFFSRLARARRNNLPRPKIFTTNYDLVIEKSLDELGFPYIDGFSGTVERKLNLSYYGLDFHRVESTSQQILQRAESSFYLHKIHGSLNWRAQTVRGGSAPALSIEVKQVSDLTSLTDGSVLIYPTASKEGDTLSYPYSDLLRLLSSSLQLPDTAVLCVGYGFWDAHINRIVLGALSMNSSMNLLIADPGGVFDPKIQITEAQLADSKNLPLEHTSLPVADRPIAAIAKIQDSRIAVLTGTSGKFERLSELLPDPSLSGVQSSPATMAALIDSLGLVIPSPEGSPGAKT